MASRAAASALTVGSILLFAATFVESAWAGWVFVLVTPLFPLLLIVLATPRRGRPGRLLGAGILALGTLMLLSAAGIRLLDTRPEPAWFLGLPVSAVLMGSGLILGPLLLVGWLFAATFDDASASISRIRRSVDAADERSD